MAYKRILNSISTSIDEKLNKIAARYNFDLGDEFEIGLCELFREVLPDKYGICRGFVVTEKDEFAGDDIIIYAKDRFPTLRLLDSGQYARKEYIPIEAVYGYIEAKHTLYLGNDTSGQGLAKAFSQVHHVKSLTRAPRNIFSIDPYTEITGYTAENRENWPSISNPLYTGIIARKIQYKQDEEDWFIDPGKVLGFTPLPDNFKHPDLVVLGQSDLLFPAIPGPETILYDSPFFVENKSTLVHKRLSFSALSLGIVMLLYALDLIKLGKMPYNRMIFSNLL